MQQLFYNMALNDVFFKLLILFFNVLVKIYITI